MAETWKQALHAAACHQVGVNFYPLAVEALGGWCHSAVSIIGWVAILLTHAAIYRISGEFGVTLIWRFLCKMRINNIGGY